MIKPTSEFNASAHMTPELQLRLMALAISGSDIVSSIFTQMADRAGLTAKGRQLREKENDRFYAALRSMMASQERLSRFHDKLDRLDQASVAALLETEQKLAEARRKLARVRERAYEITLPDGRTAKVYRDDDKVRDDSGAIVDKDLIKPEDIPANCPTWKERQEKGRDLHDAERAYREALEYRERLDKARKRAGEGGLTDEELDNLEADVDRMPDTVRRKYDAETPRGAGRKLESTEPELAGGLASAVKPGQSFRAAVAGLGAPSAASADDEFTKMPPSVSRPAPG